MTGNSISSLLFIVCSSLLSQSDGSAPLPAGADLNWLRPWQNQIDEQVGLLSTAYSLDATMQQVVREELNRRVYEQQAWELKNEAELGELVKKAEAAGYVEESPEAEAVWAKMAEYDKMPLSEAPVEEWLQKQLPPQVVAQGHVRLEELRERREAMKDADESDATKGPQVVKELGHMRVNNEAVASPDTGQPLPVGEKGQMLASQAEVRVEQQSRPQSYQVPPPTVMTGKGRTADSASPNYDPRFDPVTGRRRTKQLDQPADMGTRRQAAEAQIATSLKETTPPSKQAPTIQSPSAPPVYQTAPPLDDWDKFVISFAEKYNFSEGQVTNARSILKALKTRANQYRMSRSDAFAQAELIVDAKARSETLKQLNRPLDALFDELKQRLDSLPTQEQRHQANAPPASPMKPAGKK